MGMNCKSSCSSTSINRQISPQYRKILWIVLLLNAGMFFVEMATGVQANSMSLFSDSLDFFSDAVNYGISLWAIQYSLNVRAKASLFKAMTLFGLGIFVLGKTLYLLIYNGSTPDAPTMGMVAILAFAINVLSAILLYRYRNGDSNNSSVWLCSRNDALSNLAVLIAASVVWLTDVGYPDWIVSGLMSYLALSASIQIFKQAKRELQQPQHSDICKI